MPKKYGVVKTYSFDKKTIDQTAFLSSFLCLKPTSLLEYLINKAYNENKQEEGK